MADHLRLDVETALSAIRTQLLPLAPAHVPVLDALGWPLAASAIAAIDMPRFDASAMDGYAVRSVDAKHAPIELPLSAAVLAGSEPISITPGLAVPIATGAPIPAGADAVVARERVKLVEVQGEMRLSLTDAIEAGRNVRARGEDAKQGAAIASAGYVVGADAVGAFASYGIEAVALRRPSIGFISTGNELAIDRASLENEAAIIDSNGPMIAACCTQLGIPVRFYGRAADDTSSLEERLDALLAPNGSDILISTGGVSVGTLDLVGEQLMRRGARKIFHGIQMRPGKPMLFAVLPDGRPYFGLPGNPVAALVGFRFFVLEAVRSLSGIGREIGQAVLTNAFAKTDTTLFLRGIKRREGETTIVDTSFDQRSHVQSSVLSADTWVRLDPDGEAHAYPKTLVSIAAHCQSC